MQDHCDVTNRVEVGTAKWQTKILSPLSSLKIIANDVGYNFQGKMSDLSRYLSEVRSQKDALVR